MLACQAATVNTLEGESFATVASVGDNKVSVSSQRGLDISTELRVLASRLGKRYLTGTGELTKWLSDTYISRLVGPSEITAWAVSGALRHSPLALTRRIKALCINQ